MKLSAKKSWWNYKNDQQKFKTVGELWRKQQPRTMDGPKSPGGPGFGFEYDSRSFPLSLSYPINKGKKKAPKINEM